MIEDVGRSQTTKGIWMDKSKEGNILVFDIEGTDSKERGEQRMTFEQTTSLFALAIADVLLINMWTNDIGRYGASNDQKSSKKLLFLLRDFDKKQNFERIRGTLEADLNRIWSEIYKPDKYIDTKPSDFFQFEYCCMPHKNYQEDEFFAKAKELKERF